MHKKEALEFFKNLETCLEGKSEVEVQNLYEHFLEDIVYRAKYVTTLIISRLPPKQGADLYQRVKSHLVNEVRLDVWRFPQIMKNLKYENYRTNFFNECKSHLKLNNSQEFENILKYLTPQQRNQVYNYYKPQLVNFCNFVTDYIRITKYLNKEQAIDLFDEIISSHKEIGLMRLRNLNKVMELLDENQRFKFYSMLKPKIIKLITIPSTYITKEDYFRSYLYIRSFLFNEVSSCHKKFEKYLYRLYYQECINDFYQYCTKHDESLKPKSCLEFYHHLEIVSDDEKDKLFQANKERLPEYCHSIKSFWHIVNALPEAHRSELITMLEDRKQTMSIPIDKYFIMSMHRLCDENRLRFGRLYINSLEPNNANEFNTVLGFFPQLRNQIYSRLKEKVPQLYISRKIADPTKFLSYEQANDVLMEVAKIKSNKCANK